MRSYRDMRLARVTCGDLRYDAMEVGLRKTASLHESDRPSVADFDVYLCK